MADAVLCQRSMVMVSEKHTRTEGRRWIREQGDLYKPDGHGKVSQREMMRAKVSRPAV